MHILAHTCIYVHIRIRATYMHILAYTGTYVHIRSAVFARIFAKMKYVYACMLYVCCAVFARICTYCTYMHVFFVRKVVSRIDVRIIAHTCIYLQIRTQIRANTCKTYANTCKNLRIQYGFKDRICTYMHVYVRIFQHDTLIWTYMNIDRICTYMHVCVCI